jgi:hypothetical protein
VGLDISCKEIWMFKSTEIITRISSSFTLQVNGGALGHDGVVRRLVVQDVRCFHHVQHPDLKTEKILTHKNTNTACFLDIRFYLTPLGQVRQFYRHLWYIKSFLWKVICLLLGRFVFSAQAAKNISNLTAYYKQISI